MSACIVDRDHLDLLLTAAQAWGITDAEQAEDIGRVLWKENLASVAYRYPNDHDGDRPGPCDFRDHHVDTYHFRLYPGRVDPEVVATAAASLAYHSCEHPGWKTSDACLWVTRLRDEATERIPAYRAEHGPVDPGRQAPGESGWYVVVDANRQRHVECLDGATVPDRGVFHRAAALRTPTKPASPGPRPSPGSS